MKWEYVTAYVLLGIGFLAIAPALITAAAVWWKWLKEALQEFRK